MIYVAATGEKRSESFWWCFVTNLWKVYLQYLRKVMTQVVRRSWMKESLFMIFFPAPRCCMSFHSPMLTVFKAFLKQIYQKKQHKYIIME